MCPEGSSRISRHDACSCLMQCLLWLESPSPKLLDYMTYITAVLRPKLAAGLQALLLACMTIMLVLTCHIAYLYSSARLASSGIRCLH